MSLEQTLEAISKAITVEHVVGGKVADRCLCVIGIANKHFPMAEKDEAITVTSGENDYVKELVDLLYSVLLNEPITPGIANLAVNVSRLVFNWSKATGLNDSVLETRAQLLDRMTKNHLSTVEAIDMIRQLKNSMRTISSYAWPSVALSKHYAESLTKKG